MNATVLFHGFKVPLLGIGEDETLQECEDCGDLHCFLQTRISEDGHFRCDKCTENDARFQNKEK